MIRILALHGFLGQARDWQAVLASLERKGRRFRAFTPDLFAPTTNWLDGQGFQDWSQCFLKREDVNAFLRPSSERNILLGYSFGGRLALHLALAEPSLWDQVILISVNPGLLTPSEKVQRLENDRRWAERFSQESWAALQAAWNAQPVFAGSQEPERFEGDFDRAKLQIALNRFSLAHSEVNAEDLKRLKRTKWICGERDTKFVNLYGELHANGLIPQPRIVPGCGHRVLFDRPEAIVVDLKA